MNPKWNPERTLTVCLGSLWLLDGILQLQPAMFTSVFMNTVLAPNLQGQPSLAGAIVAFGIALFSRNIFLSNLLSALIQLLIGALLVFPFRVPWQRFALWLSIVWALIVWIFGEGFGGLFTGMATFYAGAPGSALLYAIIAFCLLYNNADRAGRVDWYKKLPLLAGILFIACALLNLAPMFWQSGIVNNLAAIAALSCLGILLIVRPNRPVAWVALIFLFGVWWIGQGFGGLQTFPGGTATDPNSAPLFVLFLLPALVDWKHS
jgi:hypothetical protein